MVAERHSPARYILSDIPLASMGTNNLSSPISLAASVNTLSAFLAFEQVGNELNLESVWQSFGPQPDARPPVDVVVIAASAVLSTADVVFSTLTNYRHRRQKEVERGNHGLNHRVVLVLCGGIGHSTQLMHDAIAKHPKYGVLAEKTVGQPEARMLQAIAEEYYDLADVLAPDGILTVLIEDESTNCGQNASMSRRVLEAHGISSPRSIVICQDPTMCRRTVATFQHVYSDLPSDRQPRYYSWPTLVPLVVAPDGGEIDQTDVISYNLAAMGRASQDGLWSMSRFLDLLLGEVPRLRDDSNGYGPMGKGFISHVDVPQYIEAAWQTLRHTSEDGRSDRI
ncbi:hypothetical protein F5Y18DRAFT_400073 [Xylariaceae sp. FL1019]|nr:hypothetical protein F5Y18DRAFT_400073 [Xylariaceae sp. FL1019]